MHEMLEAASRRLSLHMPGAQGQGPFGPVDPYRLETTELAATDDLYAPYGAVARAEALCARSATASAGSRPLRRNSAKQSMDTPRRINAR